MTSDKPSLAERMGIKIGKTVVRFDLYLTRRRGRPVEDAALDQRENRITVSAGDDGWDSVPRHFREPAEAAAA